MSPHFEPDLPASDRVGCSAVDFAVSTFVDKSRPQQQQDGVPSGEINRVQRIEK